MRVAFSAAAESDLRDIGDYVRAERGVSSADRLVTQLVDACADLMRMPLSHPIVPRYRQRGYRRTISGRYLIFFRISGDEIEVIRILHGARDVTRLLA